MNNKIFNTVVESIASQLNTPTEITAEKSLKEDLGLPSIKMVMILTDVTTQLEISIMDFSDYELLRLKTVGDLVELLTTKTKEANENN